MINNGSGMDVSAFVIKVVVMEIIDGIRTAGCGGRNAQTGLVSTASTSLSPRRKKEINQDKQRKNTALSYSEDCFLAFFMPSPVRKGKENLVRAEPSLELSTALNICLFVVFCVFPFGKPE